MMVINYLKSMAVFAQVVETGSFTAAGKNLGLARGKVSEQVSRLEDYTGVRLFIRSTRSVKVTAEGEALYQHTKQLLQNGIEGLDEISSFNTEVKGRIRITTTSDFYDCLLLPILKGFCQRHPQIQLDMQITEDTLAVIDDSIDLAIRSGTLADSSLITLPLTKTRLKIYASANFRGNFPQTPDELEQLNWIGLHFAKSQNSITLSHHDGSQFTFPPSYKHVANSISSYRQLIEADFGIGLIAEHTASVLVKQGRLQPILPDWHGQEIAISLLYPHRVNMAKRTRLLINELKTAFE